MSERWPGARRPGVSRRSLGARPAIVIAAALAAFLVLGSLAERLEYFGEARDTLRGQAGPAGLPNEGAVGRAVALAMERYGVNGVLGRLSEALPSTLMVPPERLDGPFPVISIATDEDYLNDPAIGIMQNMREIGPAWERLASVSLWEDGEMVLGSRVGLRIHGDSTRYRGDPSFRLYFRPRYGATSAGGGRLLGPAAQPAAVVVVHVVRWRGHYPNIFVFEMARRLGLPTVAFRPVSVFLNGEPRGIYVLTERVMPDGWGRTHFGDANFFMYVYKGETRRPSREAHADLEAWVTASAPLTMRDAEQRIDVANLTRHLFTVMFAYTTDWAQGAALLDRNDAERRWFWMHWDMDQSFYLRGIVEVEPWAQPFMAVVTLRGTRDELEAWGIVTDDRHNDRHRLDVRRIIFMQLLEDPEYRRYFVRFVTDALNHELTPAFLDRLLAQYSDLELAPGLYSRVDLGEYFRRRPDFVRAELGDYFRLGQALSVRIDGAPGTRLLVDGYAETGVYEGRYFHGQTLRVERLDATAPPISHWLVNGARVDGARLELVVNADTVIEPVFDGTGG